MVKGEFISDVPRVAHALRTGGMSERRPKQVETQEDEVELNADVWGASPTDHPTAADTIRDDLEGYPPDVLEEAGAEFLEETVADVADGVDPEVASSISARRSSGNSESIRDRYTR